MKAIVLIEALNAALVGAIALAAALLGCWLMIWITGISFAYDHSAPFYEKVCAISVPLWIATYLVFLRRDRSLRRIGSVTLWLPLTGTILVCGPFIGLVACVEYCWVFFPMTFAVAMLIRYCMAVTKRLT